MTSSRFAILDPAAGVSGDMLLGALLDVGAPEEWLRSLPRRLGLSEVSLQISRVRRCGIAASRVEILLPGSEAEGPAPVYDRARHRQQGHDHAAIDTPWHPVSAGHRHLTDILELLDRADISTAVRARAGAAFQMLCEAEAGVHGVAPEAVVLHEVGAADAVIDIVGVLEGFEQLGIERICLRPVALGSGWVHAAHGVIAVPAPVTLRLLEGLEIGADGPVTGEATTPTGAVLLQTLNGGAPPRGWRPVRSGWGAGARDPEHYPNVVRLVLADPVSEAGQVVTLSSDLDDLNPEYLEPLREALTAAGALDVVLWGTQMKKGRPGFRIEVICDTHSTDAVAEAFFLHSTTSGIRRSASERMTLERRQIEVAGPDGVAIPVKVRETPAGPRVKAEYEAVRAAARRSGRPALDVAREAEQLAQAQVAHRPPGGTPSPKEQG